jgi:diacylglycerol kinase family enzyme
MPGERWEGDLILVTVANGRQAGGGFPVAPKAALDDGLLDIMVVHSAGLPQSGQVLREFREVDSQENEYLFYRQVPSCRLEFREEVRLNVDGEPTFHHTFDFRILPRRLKIILPPETPLSWQ